MGIRNQMIKRSFPLPNCNHSLVKLIEQRLDPALPILGYAPPTNGLRLCRGQLVHAYAVSVRYFPW